MTAYRALNHTDIEVFSEAISVFFENMTKRSAQVRTAYLLEGDDPIVWDDFNGLIKVSGGFRGTITFSAPRALIDEVLNVMGEPSKTTENYLDVVGEIANQLSGRARKHFGESLDISTPISCKRGGFIVTTLATGPAYAIPLTWGAYQAHLVVHLDLASRR